MKISADVRKYAQERNLQSEEALNEGMRSKSEEFRKGGSARYVEKEL
jgi:phosphomethylpyrimidine synthase